MTLRLAYRRLTRTGYAWFPKLPEHWRLSRLKHVSSINDETLPEGTGNDHEIEYVDIGGVTRNVGITRIETLLFGDAPSRARRLVRHGDVIVSTVRTYLKAITKIENPPANLVVSTGFAVVRPEAELDADFLGRALASEEFVGSVIANSDGVNYPAITSSRLGDLSLPVPPLREQRTIAAFLDHETARIDRLIEKQQRLIKLLEEKRQAVISHAVTKGLDPDAPMKDSGVEWLGHVPAHWAIIRTGLLFREVSEQGGADLPILSVSIHHGVSSAEMSDEELSRKVARSEDRTKYKRVRPNDLTFNMMRAWQGAFGAVRNLGQVSPAYIVARPISSAIEPRFYEKQIRTPAGAEEVRRYSRGITDFRLRLYWDEFKEIRCAVPPLAEQREILEFLDSQEEQITNLAAKLREAIGLLREHRAALISAAVTGQIDVRDWQPTVEEAEAPLLQAAEEPATYG